MKSKYLIAAFLITFHLPLFAQQADMSLIPYRKANLWGYANQDKIMVISPAYDEANPFYAGYAAVKKGPAYGYINTGGRLVIPFKYFSAKRFRYGYTDNVKTKGTDTVLFAGAALTAEAIERCIDTRGNQMLKCPAMNENNFPGNNDVLLKDTSVSSYSTMKKSETFDRVVDGYKLPGSEDDYYIAVKNDQYGVINNKFERIAPFEYSSVKKLVINNIVYLLVEEHGLKGILNGNGSVFLPVENSRIDPVHSRNGNDYLIISRNGNTGIRDMVLQDLVAAKYSDIQYDNNGGYILTGNNGMKGYFFGNNKLLEPDYTDIQPVYGGNYVLVRSQTGKSGYISNKGIEFFEE